MPLQKKRDIYTWSAAKGNPKLKSLPVGGHLDRPEAWALCLWLVRPHPDCEGILGGLGLGWELSLFIHSNPFWHFTIKKGSLADKGLLSRRDHARSLSNIFWIKDILHPPQLGVCRNLNPVHGYSPWFRDVIPADYDHLLGQAGLHI